MDFEIEIKRDIPIGVQLLRQLSFFRLISIRSRVFSKPLITSGTCKTPKRGRGRHFNRTDVISGKVNRRISNDLVANRLPCSDCGCKVVTAYDVLGDMT